MPYNPPLYINFFPAFDGILSRILRKLMKILPRCATLCLNYMESAESANDSARSFLDKEGVPSLPNWKKLEKPFAKIAVLNIDTKDKDKIVLWWKMDKQNMEKLAETKEVSSSINLPKNEQSEIERCYQTSLDLYKDAGWKLLDFLDKKEVFAKRVWRLYASALGADSDSEKAARELVITVENFNSSKEDLQLATGVGQAIIETRDANPDEMMIRKKIAQHAFNEMFDQFTYARIGTVNDIDMVVSGIIDSPAEEKSDLTSTLLSNPWTGDERRKMLSKYNRLKNVMNRLETNTEYKVALNTLWKWANGELPQDSSVFKILHYADNLDQGATDSLIEAWQQEAENKDDEDE